MSMCMELTFEFLVDTITLDVERGHGVTLDKFWAMWRLNPFA